MIIKVEFKKVWEIMERRVGRFDAHRNGFGELLVNSIFWDGAPTELIGEVDNEYYEECLKSGDTNEIVIGLTRSALEPYTYQFDYVMDGVEIGKILDEIFRSELKKATNPPA